MKGENFTFIFSIKLRKFASFLWCEVLPPFTLYFPWRARWDVGCHEDCYLIIVYGYAHNWDFTKFRNFPLRTFIFSFFLRKDPFLQINVYDALEAFLISDIEKKIGFATYFCLWRGFRVFFEKLVKNKNFFSIFLKSTWLSYFFNFWNFLHEINPHFMLSS